MTTGTTTYDTATAVEIRSKVRELTVRLDEARDAERVVTEALEAARARRALTGETRAETGLDRAQKQLAQALDERLGIESAIARLERGLELAQAAEHTAATRRWAQRAEAERKAVVADRDRVVRMIGQIIEALEAEDGKLLARKAELERLGYDAAAEGASWHVAAARPLSHDHRAYRSVLETLVYIRSIRQQAN